MSEPQFPQPTARPDNYYSTDEAIMRQNLHVSLASLVDSNLSIRQQISVIAEILQGITHMLAKEYELEDYVETITLTGGSQEVPLQRYGRRFLLIFTPVAIASCALKIRGLAGYTFTLAAGWNILNTPDGSQLTTPTNTNQTVLIKATNWCQAGAI